MQEKAVRFLIRAKLADGALPQRRMPRAWGSPGAGQRCDACEETITQQQFAMTASAVERGGRAFHFHVRCFGAWDASIVGTGR